MEQADINRAKPILFNTEMVKAILDGRKTVTRRLIKPEFNHYDTGVRFKKWFDGMARFTSDKHNALCDRKPKYQKGDILYVREKHVKLCRLDGNEQIIEDTEQYYYAADNDIPFDFILDPDTDEHRETPKWRPSIHMPKGAARIFLRVTDVRVERLQDITEEEAMKEGVNSITTPYIQGKGRTHIQGFGELWNSTIPKKDLDRYGWGANPWVWVYTFERCA